MPVNSLVIATHYLVYGAAQALRDYSLERQVDVLLYIAHPLSGETTDSPYYEYYEHGVRRSARRYCRGSTGEVARYARDWLRTVMAVFRTRRRYDVFVGVDSLNALAGIFLRRLGRVRRVIFYTIDYVPKRFENRLLNTVYHWCDHLCVALADETWNVSPRIAEGREIHRGLRQSVYTRQRVVPIGIWFADTEEKAYHPHRIIFVGHLLEKQGAQLVIEALSNIRAALPDVEYQIVGGGPYEAALRKRVAELGLEDSVRFSGWVKDPERLRTLLAEAAVGVAPYDSTKDTFTYYADATKLKDYLAAGLPIILTDLPHNAHDIEAAGCGVVIGYDVEKMAQAVLSLLTDQARLQSSRASTRRYIRQFDWHVIFDREFSRLETSSI